MNRLLFFFSLFLATSHFAFGQCETFFNKSCPYSEKDSLFQQVIEKDAYCCYAFGDANCQASYDYLQKQRQQERSVTVKNDTLCERSLWRDDNVALCEVFSSVAGFLL